ncbi:hypothetical protein SCUP234_00519 [Seiridium cupressi]
MMSETIQTQDGIRLSYTQTGPSNGPNVLFLPGWRQTAAQWYKQVEHFQSNFRVTTVDYRGHGESEKSESAPGYTIQQFSSDLNDVLHALDLKSVTLVGHSMGSGVIFALWNYFPESRGRVNGIVMADGSARMLIDPTWTEEQAKQFGGVFTQELVDNYFANFDVMFPSFFKAMFSDKISKEDLAWATAQNEKCPKEIAIKILGDHTVQDWRSILPSIGVPALIICGTLAAESGAWLQEQLPNSETAVFGRDEGLPPSSHFMFFENTHEFNSLVERFIQEKIRQA